MVGHDVCSIIASFQPKGTVRYTFDYVRKNQLIILACVSAHIGSIATITVFRLDLHDVALQKMKQKNVIRFGILLNIE